jgi:hypothetical protein
MKNSKDCKEKKQLLISSAVLMLSNQKKDKPEAEEKEK